MTVPSVAGASHVSFTVTDLPAAVAWFERVFGAEVMMREQDDDREAAVLTLPGTTFLVGLGRFVDGSGDPFDPRRTGLDHLALAVDSEAELEAWVAHLTSEGVEHSGLQPAPPGTFLNLKGPDGIALALFWRR